jgi:phosphate transport system substrate-binding protein
LIDKVLRRFLDFSTFDAPGFGRGHFALVAGSLTFAALLGGCSPQRPGHHVVEDSITSGRISIVCASDVEALVRRERDAFVALYPDASIGVRSGGSREAIRALFAAECDVAAIARELEPEERAAAMRGGLELEGYRFARDGVAVVVHPDNPVENIALDDLRGIYTGSVTRWSQVGGKPTAILPVFPPPASDIAAFFAQRVMQGEQVQVPVVYEASDSGVVAYVRAHPEAIGFVSLGWADRGARALRLASLKGLPFWKPDPEAVYHGDYPLTRFMNLYARPGGRPLANGFITYVTSRDGQEIVHEEGLVPTAVPVRFVRRSPMLGSHK